MKLFKELSKRTKNLKILKGKISIFDVISVLLFVMLTTLFILNFFYFSRIEQLNAGDVADKDVFASLNIDIPDIDTTNSNKKEAELKSPNVYNYYPDAFSRVETTMKEFFSYVKEYRDTKSEFEDQKEKDNEEQKTIEKIMEEGFEKKALHYTSPVIFYSVVKLNKDEIIKNVLIILFKKIYSQGFIENKASMILKGGSGYIYNSKTHETNLIKSLPPLIERTEVKNQVYNYLKTNDEIKKSEYPVVYSLVNSFLLPAFSLNIEKTDELRNDAIKTTETTFFKKKKGEVILRKGEKITATAAKFIEKQNMLLSKDVNLYKTISAYLILLIIVFFLYRLTIIYNKFETNDTPFLFSLYIWVLIFSVVIIKVVVFIVGAVARNSSLQVYLSGDTMFYAVPFAFAAVLVAVLIDSIAALLIIIIMPILVLMLTAGNIYFTFYTIFSSLSAIYLIRKSSQRTPIIYSSFFLGLFNFLFIVLVNGYFGHSISFTYCVIYFIVAMISSLLTFSFATLLSPGFESIYSITSDMRLLELANMNNKLLQELSLKAPGTYQHSIILANMAEAAAKKIGANSLLTRVGAYYHDIGKMIKPEYFIENQRMGEENKHNKLTAKMSSIILTNHIKDGVKLAKLHKLPKPLFNFITEHHGTKLMAFFYNKAVAAVDDEEEVFESDYRYGGPTPGSKETAILMIADAVEAASRTLKPPVSAGKLQNLVTRIVKNLVDDKQMDEANITFKELTEVSHSFLESLAAMFHTRIDYPGFDFNSAEKNDSKVSEKLDNENLDKNENQNKNSGEKGNS